MEVRPSDAHVKSIVRLWSIVLQDWRSRLAQPVSAVCPKCLSRKLNLLGRYCSEATVLPVVVEVAAAVLAVLPACPPRHQLRIGSSGEPESDLKAIAHSAHLHSL